jgi:hypothetical protein
MLCFRTLAHELLGAVPDDLQYVKHALAPSEIWLPSAALYNRCQPTVLLPAPCRQSYVKALSNTIGKNQVRGHLENITIITS